MVNQSLSDSTCKCSQGPIETIGPEWTNIDGMLDSLDRINNQPCDDANAIYVNQEESLAPGVE